MKTLMIRNLIGLVAVGAMAINVSLCRADLPVTDGLMLWLDAADGSTLFQNDSMTEPAESGGQVVAWADKSGNDFHATALFDGPTFEPDAINGQNGLLFNGGEFGAGLAVDPALEVLRPYSIFVAQQNVTHGRTLQSATANWLHGSWGTSFTNFANGFVGSVPAELGLPIVMDTTGTIEGNSTLFLNNLDITNDPAPTGSPGQLGLGSAGMFANEAASALVSEVVVYDRVLSGEELGSVREYLYGKYSISDFTVDLGAEKNTVLVGEVGGFTGGDEGDGLDLLGDFVYGVNVGGIDAVVGDVEFLEASLESGDPAGVVITNAVNELPAWFPSNFGESVDDIEIGNVAQSIRYGGDLMVDLDVVPGESYKLQLLFSEGCCDRGFDITVEDELVVDNLHLPDLQGSISNGGVMAGFYAGTFTASDDQLNIHLGGKNPRAADSLPTLSGVTLERISIAIPGDFNGDGLLDAADIDALSAVVRAGTNDLSYDVNNDQVVDQADRAVWVADLSKTYVGDANLDGSFDSTDFVSVFVAGLYETGQAAGWGAGDWDGDGLFDSSDFVAAFVDGGYEAGPRQVLAVPEPSSVVLLLLGLVAFASRRRR